MKESRTHPRGVQEMWRRAWRLKCLSLVLLVGSCTVLLRQSVGTDHGNNGMMNELFYASAQVENSEENGRDTVEKDSRLSSQKTRIHLSRTLVESEHDDNNDDDGGDSDAIPFSTLSPLYLTFGVLSLVGTLCITWLYLTTPNLRKEHSSTMIQILTIFDFAYTLKFTFTALFYEIHPLGKRHSFQLINDNCRSAAIYEQVFGMAVVAWNTCWMFDYICVLRNPLRNTKSFRKFYLGAVLGVCLSTAVGLSSMGNNETSSDYVCWIMADTSTSHIFDGFLYLSISIALASLGYSWYRLRQGTEATVKLRRSMLKRHFTYVMAYVALWLWPTTFYFRGMGHRSKLLTIVDVIATAGQAAIYSCIRLADPVAWQLLLDKTKLHKIKCLVPKRTVWKRHYGESNSDSEAFQQGHSSMELSPPDNKGSTKRASQESIGTEGYSYRMLGASHRLENKDTLSEPLLLENTPSLEDDSDEERSSRVLENQSRTKSERPDIYSDTEVFSIDKRWKATEKWLENRITSAGHAWDVSSGLRLELAMCMLSGICQFVLPFDLSKTENRSVPKSNRLAMLTSVKGLVNNAPDEDPVSDSDSNASEDESVRLSLASEDSFLHERSATQKENLRLRSKVVKWTRLLTNFRKVQTTMQIRQSNSPNSANLLPPLIVRGDFGRKESATATVQESINDSSRAENGTGNTNFKGERCVQVKRRGFSQRLMDGRREHCKPSQSADDLKAHQKFRICSIADEKFSHLRKLGGVLEEIIVDELDPYFLQAGEVHVHFSEGASSSFFCHSRHNRFMVKTATHQEVCTLLELLPSYIGHLESHPDSLLCRFYGCFELKAGGVKNYFILMGNMFPCVKYPQVWETYDLKGSSVGRTQRVNESVEISGKKPRAHRRVLYQDEDFQQIRNGRFLAPPLELLQPAEDSSILFSSVVDQLSEDIQLLKQFGLMDYSLLLNVMPVGGSTHSEKALTLMQQKEAPFVVQNIRSLSQAQAVHIQKTLRDKRWTREDSRTQRDNVRQAKENDISHRSTQAFATRKHWNANDLGGTHRLERSHPVSPLIRPHNRSDYSGTVTHKRIPQWSALSVIPVTSLRNLDAESRVNRLIDEEPEGESIEHADKGGEEQGTTEEEALVQIGIIDVLQPYGVMKKLEKGMKAIRHGSWDVDISSTDPEKYAERFKDMVCNAFGRHTGHETSDQCRTEIFQ